MDFIIAFSSYFLLISFYKIHIFTNPINKKGFFGDLWGL